MRRARCRGPRVPLRKTDKNFNSAFVKSPLIFVVQKIGEGGPSVRPLVIIATFESSKSHFDVRKKANGMQRRKSEEHVTLVESKSILCFNI